MTAQTIKPTNESSSEYVQVLNNAAGLEYGFKAALASVPSEVYPGNPAQQDVIPQVDSAYNTVAKFLIGLVSLTNVANTWESGKRLYYAENKNLDAVADFGFNFLKTGAWFAFLGVIAAGAIFVAPYLLIAMAGLGIAYGAFNIGKHLVEAYRAHKENNKEERAKQLNAIPGQMLITALNALCLVFSIDLGLTLPAGLENAANLMQSGQFFAGIDAFSAVGAGFQAAKVLFYAIAATATLGAISSKSTWDMNLETLNALRHPLETFQKAKNAVVEKIIALKTFVGRNPLKVPLAIIAVGFEVLSLATQLITRTIALAATPLLLIGAGIRKTLSFCATQLANGFKSLFGKKEKAAIPAQNPEPIEPSSTVSINARFEKKHEELRNKVEKQLEHLNSQKQTPKIAAKKALVTNLKIKLSDKIESYDSKIAVVDLKNSAQTISPSVYQSFWRSKSKTAELAENVEALDVQMRSAAAGA
ncbi:MAG: hypothetical protein P4M12_03475 [Gammaproteobacteria bacterium]|nr:hypothetical protein [Gammaproteobacteria bacterium]